MGYLHMNDDAPNSRISDPAAYALIGGISLGVFGLVFWLVYGRDSTLPPPDWTHVLPSLNALCNTASAICLAIAVICIRRGYRRAHVGWILGALAFSGLFLVGYLAHHSFHGDTRFLGQGLIRPAYFVVLVTHILLSMVVVPLVLTTLFFAVTGRFPRHRRLARWTFPTWMIVSVSGVLVYLLLRAYA